MIIERPLAAINIDLEDISKIATESILSLAILLLDPFTNAMGETHGYQASLPQSR